MSCLKYYLKKNVLKRKTSAWCMISLCRGRWQMTKFNQRWRSLWFGLVWLVIWRCKKVNDCEVILLFLILHILNRTSLACALFSSFVDRELCDSESDMPLGIQMCMVSLITVSSCPHCCLSVASLASFTHLTYAFYLSFLYRMTQQPHSNKSIVHNQFWATLLPSWTQRIGSTIQQWLPCPKRRSVSIPWHLDCPVKRYVSLFNPTILCTGRSLVLHQHCTPNHIQRHRDQFWRKVVMKGEVTLLSWHRALVNRVLIWVMGWRLVVSQ